MLNENIDLHSRNGYYIVGNLIFYNKSDALIYASVSNLKIYWNFNDEVFSKINWTTEIPASLNELYKQRALQLREKYDYVSLFYSGGSDSNNILHTFIDNNILLDEIIMFRPKVLDSKKDMNDLSGENSFSEIEFAAIPHLKQYLKNTTSVVRIIEIDAALKKFLDNDTLVSQYSHSTGHMSHSTFSKIAMSVTDDKWNNLYNANKKVCHIHGSDKPWVECDINNNYSFKFRETISFIFEAGFSTADSEARMKNQFHEAFYWTPDLPELVIKQCQVVKKMLETDKVFKTSHSRKKYNEEQYLCRLNKLLYSPVVNSVRDLFTTGKTNWNTYGSPNDWIDKGLTDANKNLYNEILGSMLKLIDNRYLLLPLSRNYAIIKLINSKEYKL